MMSACRVKTCLKITINAIVLCHIQKAFIYSYSPVATMLQSYCNKATSVLLIRSVHITGETGDMITVPIRQILSWQHLKNMIYFTSNDMGTKFSGQNLNRQVQIWSPKKILCRFEYCDDKKCWTSMLVKNVIYCYFFILWKNMRKISIVEKSLKPLRCQYT